ncbi:hypothetical protein LguiB_036022 [Lonicera macranthoides]
MYSSFLLPPAPFGEPESRFTNNHNTYLSRLVLMDYACAKSTGPGESPLFDLISPQVRSQVQRLRRLCSHWKIGLDSIFWTRKEQVNQSRFLLWSRAREAKDKARVKRSSSLSTTSWN